MSIVAAAVVFATCLSGVIDGLQCNRCNELYPGSAIYLANTNEDCQNSYECESTEDTCYSHWSYEVASGKLVIDKGCANRNECELNKAKTELYYQCTQFRTKWQCYECCTGELCNQNDAMPMQVLSVVTMVTGLCFSFFWTLL